MSQAQVVFENLLLGNGLLGILIQYKSVINKFCMRKNEMELYNTIEKNMYKHRIKLNTGFPQDSQCCKTKLIFPFNLSYERI